MSRKPNRRSTSSGGRSGNEAANSVPVRSDAPDASERLALSHLDWAAAGLVCAILIISPIWLATFATPTQRMVFSVAALEEQGWLGHAMDIFAGPLVLLLASAAVIVLSWRETKRPVAMGAVPGLAAALSAVAVWGVFSAVHNSVAYLSLNSLCFLLCALIVGGMVSRLGRDPQFVGALVVTIAIAGTLIAAIGNHEYLDEWKKGVTDHRVFATFGPDFLAGYLLLTLPVTLAAFAAANGRSLRLALGVGLALQSGCVFLTGSRAGTAISVLVVLIWAAVAILTGADRTRRRWLVTGVAIFLIGSTISATPTLTRLVKTNPSPHKEQSDSSIPRQDAAAQASQSAGVHQVAMDQRFEHGPEDTQAHSGEFRKSTWMGTVRMALRNPWLGTGIGTFAVAYPKYSDTAFTAHAHNSFLQWTGEAGFPGAIALLTSFAAASAFVLHILLLMRTRRRDLELVGGGSATPVLFGAPGLLLAGFVAALIGSTLHNLFDSDLYVVATLITFAAVFGLVIAQARVLAPLATQTPRPLGREIWVVSAFVCLFLFGRAAQTGASRWHRDKVERSPSGMEAIDAAHAAGEADPFDPEPHIVLGQLEGLNMQAEHEFQEAARIAPTGRTLYLLGQYYRKVGKLTQAVEALEKARGFEPHNLQALRALAETQRRAGLTSQAQLTYQTMAILESGAFGMIRAMPELVETDFAYAHAGLGEIAAQSHKLAEAEREYGKSADVLRHYWQTRNWLINLSRHPEKRRSIAELYVRVLLERTAALKQLNKAEDIPQVEEELKQVQTDILDDEKNNKTVGDSSGRKPHASSPRFDAYFVVTSDYQRSPYPPPLPPRFPPRPPPPPLP